jgi:hypothetical protein
MTHEQLTGMGPRNLDALRSLRRGDDPGVYLMVTGSTILVRHGELTDAGREVADELAALDRCGWLCLCGEKNPGMERRMFCRRCFDRKPLWH